MARTGRAAVIVGKEFEIREYPVPDPEPGAVGEVCDVNVDTCIGCQLCAKFCPPDYDAVHMFPHDKGMELTREELRTYEYRQYNKKKGGALPG